MSEASGTESRFMGLTGDVVNRFRVELESALQRLCKSELTPQQFHRFVEELKTVTQQAGRRVLEGVLSELDETARVIEHDGMAHRYKMTSDKEWLTPFGLISVSRRYYQPDVGGVGIVPLDVRIGMVDRFMTSDVEEMVAFASGMLVPREVETLLRKLLPHGPSATAIQQVIRGVGTFAGDFAPDIEEAIQEREPLATEGDVVAVSWDGINVPLREEAPHRGRPAERPGVRDSEQASTAWKEASVAAISVYQRSGSAANPLERIDARYLARMPEPSMVHLLDRLEWIVTEVRSQNSLATLVVICDGKPAIWKVVENTPVYEDAVHILDFYHAMQHLSKAAEAIFGKQQEHAQRWFHKYRLRIRDENGGTEAAITSMRYYLRDIPQGTQRYNTINRVISFFSKNLERMHYATFRAQGLPIGSGPVEAACKTVVGARIKRSGMRWSREGGQHVLNLRAHILSNRWDTFWNTYETLRAA